VTDEREVIPAGKQPMPWYRHLLPIGRFLIEERGHLPLERPDKFGFAQKFDGYKCELTRGITEEDWAALNERVVIPDNVVYIFNVIRDQMNGVEIVGFDEMEDPDGVIPIDVWVERQRAEGYDFGAGAHSS
jgi:hypothetical protein